MKIDDGKVYLYAIAVGDRGLKIGYSCDPPRRAKEICGVKFRPRVIALAETTNPRWDEVVLLEIIKRTPGIQRTLSVRGKIEREYFTVESSTVFQSVVELFPRYRTWRLCRKNG